MIPVFFDYATPSVFESSRDETLVGITANARRPVRFHGKVVRETFLLRIALRALGEAIWSNDTWLPSSILDPVITVHPDRVFFEAFSQDQSAYAQVSVDPALFETSGEVRTGTTNVDFTAWLWAALGELRTSRDTWFRIEAGGFEVRTVGAGGRFERKVELPDEWVRGFLQLQAAMALPGTRLTARPVDVLAAQRFLQYTRARVSPRALRYEFEPGQDAQLVLEPWEHVIRLKGAEHNYTQRRVIRTWGRRRLKLIAPLLPFADSVDIYLKGRALPSFYVVHLPGITFTLGLSGWTAQGWTGTGSFDLLSDIGGEDPALLDQTLRLLRDRVTVSVSQVATELKQTPELANRLLARLCRQGRAIYDVEKRHFRHRELFEQPIDEARLYPPDERRITAERLVGACQVKPDSCQPRETRKVRRLKTPDGPIEREVIYRDWQVKGRVDDQEAVEIVVNDTGSIIFGVCGCPFFQENLLNKGPCAHQLALLLASADYRQDLPTSTDALYAPVGVPARPRVEDQEDEKEEKEVESEEEEKEE